MQAERLRPISDAIAAGDYASAFARFLTLAGRLPKSSAWEAGCRLLGARVLRTAPAERPALVRQGVLELRAAVGEEIEPAWHADLLMLAGSPQEALERLIVACKADPTSVSSSHRLGLGELARALRSPLADPVLTVERWTRALSYLGVALADRRFRRAWADRRAAHYGEPIDEEALRDGVERVVGLLRRLLIEQAERADAAQFKPTGDALRSLATEWEIDRAGCAAFEAARELLVQPDFAAEVPVPFSLIWYRTMGAPPVAARLLAELGVAVEHVPATNRDLPVDLSAPTHGALLRQWFSRLAPVRLALHHGQFGTARTLLAATCSGGEGCRPANPPSRTVTVCDSGCARFAFCNPGYAALPNPGATMTRDATLLAIRIGLALAGAHASAKPPRFFEAAQEWVLSRSLGTSISAEEMVQEEMIAQVMSLLETMGNRSEDAAQLLEKALAAAPTPTLRGRLADSLAERGIERCNADRWEDGAQDLSSAARLNRHSRRAWTNLGRALRNLATLQYNDSRYSAARETLKDLVLAMEDATRWKIDDPTIQSCLDWARQSQQEWPERDETDLLDDLLRQYGS